ncbi:MAG: hypothetical protein WC527_00880 [Candidatus Margulisiibacteriota bacterium]
MAEQNKRPRDTNQYMRELARRAFRNVPSFEDRAIERVENRLEMRKDPIPKQRFTGLGTGLAAGIMVCVLAYYFGIPFSSTEKVFITVQFGLLGGLITYICS